MRSQLFHVSIIIMIHAYTFAIRKEYKSDELNLKFIHYFLMRFFYNIIFKAKAI